jgi:hypothetical protein
MSDDNKTESIYRKYPKTFHCPESKPNAHGNDRVLDDLSAFIGKEVVVSVKLDGENFSCYQDKIHARSIDSGSHPSRTWIKAFHATFAHRIPIGHRICGENLQAKHSIEYNNLPTYFFVFGIYNAENVCLSWDETTAMCKELGLTQVPVLYRGVWDEDKVKACYTGRTIIDGVDMGEQEGFVCRLTSSFHYDEFANSVYKFVAPHFKPGNEHWSKQAYVANKLK